MLNQNLDILNFLNMMDDFVQIMDPDFDIIWMNDSGFKMLKQLNCVPSLHQNIFEAMPFLKQQQEIITKEYLRVINNQEVVVSDDSNNINGKMLHTRTTKLPLTQDGTLYYIITIVNDQTRLMDTINALTIERAQLISLFDSINEAIYVCDFETYDLIYINHTLMSMLQEKTGFSEKEIMSKKCYDLFQKGDKPCSFCSNSILRQNPDSYYQWTHHNEVLDADYILTDKLIQWTDGRTAKFELAIDVTTELRATKKLETTIKQLEHSNKMLEDFAHIVSHDLQEPLRTIVSFLDIVKEHSVECDLDSNVADFIDRAYHGGLRMQKMINELLLLSKLNKQIEPLQKIEIDMHKLLNDIIDDLQIKINETNTQIMLKDLQNVYGEYQLIRQIFLNIINNAIDHRYGNPPVIAIDSVDNIYSILYIIQDNGKGLSQDQIDKTFRWNSEWEPPTSLNGGMGVPICRRAVALHGGTICADSDGQTGTTIYVSLPTEKPDATPENTPEKA